MMAGVCVPWGGEACRLLSPIRRRFPVSSTTATLALPQSSSMIVDDNLGAFLKVWYTVNHSLFVFVLHFDLSIWLTLVFFLDSSARSSSPSPE